jgi:hypothetical protein
LANKEQPVGRFYVYNRYEDNYNKPQVFHQKSDILPECIEALKKLYGLTDEVIRKRIKID